LQTSGTKAALEFIAGTRTPEDDVSTVVILSCTAAVTVIGSIDLNKVTNILEAGIKGDL
jgi:hypothetical protein